MTQHTEDAAAAAASASARDSRFRAKMVGAYAPIALTAITAVITATWIPALPDPIAVHWSGDTPDGFGTAWLFVLTPLLVCGLFGVFVTAAARPTPAGLLTASQKLVLVVSIGLAGLLSIGLGGTLWVQRGLENAADASGGAIWMLWGLLAGVALAVSAWFFLPKSDTTRVVGEAPRPLDLAPTERVSWSRSIALSRGARLALIVAVGLAFAGLLVVAASGSRAGIAVALAAFVLLVGLGVATTRWRVTIDRRGLVVRSALGWPRITIPVEQVRDVTVVDVTPIADFGGWGWRWSADGRRGIIVRAGEAIQVTRTSGPAFVITVDDARTGAAVLAGVRSPR
ncbi:DUF1648 domain-containing protein [Planctomonas psychrotolerans]|uniref:DUF1648 domain-containing protein n=1 Tax=Planctomonas psychrotolerans TaxID=2528712 RepID=UPI0012388969|nr:DUF1648 domain-containing protein [Planctomonas psychrotolerans]